MKTTQSEQPPRQTMLPMQPQTTQRRRAPSEEQTSVLLVEGEGDDATVCQYLLEREGFTILRARTCKEATEVARERRPQLIIADVTLPDGGGYELAMEVKLMPDLAHVPIVGLSAFSSHPDAPEPPPQVFAAYLTKPIHRESFSRTIRDLLSERITRAVKQRRDRALRIEPQEQAADQ